MNRWWLDILSSTSTEALVFVAERGEEPATDYQFKWNVPVSIATRSVAGELRHLPTKSSVKVRLRLPI